MKVIQFSILQLEKVLAGKKLKKVLAEIEKVDDEKERGGAGCYSPPPHMYISICF